MLLEICLGHLLAFLAELVDHGGIHCQLFADGVASESPDDLVAPLGLVCIGGAGEDLLVDPVDILVVVANGFADGLRHGF